MMNIVEREANLKDFLLQKYYDSSNNLPSWVITSCVIVLTLSVLISQYVPTVPKFVADLQILSYQLNKFGFCLGAIILFYLLRTSLGFLFFQSIGEGKKWTIFYFTATKFYFILSFY
uniref:YIP1 family protein n=1 Tax=Chryseobacterium endophyticum TaxID=1854762 RepID=A0AAU6WQW9_9FLAO